MYLQKNEIFVMYSLYGGSAEGKREYWCVVLTDGRIEWDNCLGVPYIHIHVVGW